MGGAGRANSQLPLASARVALDGEGAAPEKRISPPIPELTNFKGLRSEVSLRGESAH